MDQLLSDLHAKLAELIAERDRLVAEVPAAHEAVRLALRAHEDAQVAWNNLVLRVNRSCGAYEGRPGILTPVMAQILDQERDRYSAAGATLTKARQNLSNLQWDVSCRNDDCQAIEAFLDPPKPATSPQRMIRPAPASPQALDDDIIVMPPGTERAA